MAQFEGPQVSLANDSDLPVVTALTVAADYNNHRALLSILSDTTQCKLGFSELRKLYSLEATEHLRGIVLAFHNIERPITKEAIAGMTLLAASVDDGLDFLIEPTRGFSDTDAAISLSQLIESSQIDFKDKLILVKRLAHYSVQSPDFLIALVDTLPKYFEGRFQSEVNSHGIHEACQTSQTTALGQFAEAVDVIANTLRGLEVVSNQNLLHKAVRESTKYLPAEVIKVLHQFNHGRLNCLAALMALGNDSSLALLPGILVGPNTPPDFRRVACYVLFNEAKEVRCGTSIITTNKMIEETRARVLRNLILEDPIIKKKSSDLAASQFPEIDVSQLLKIFANNPAYSYTYAGALFILAEHTKSNEDITSKLIDNLKRHATDFTTSLPLIRLARDIIRSLYTDSNGKNYARKLAKDVAIWAAEVFSSTCSTEHFRFENVKSANLLKTILVFADLDQTTCNSIRSSINAARQSAQATSAAKLACKDVANYLQYLMQRQATEHDVPFATLKSVWLEIRNFKISATVKRVEEGRSL